MPTRDVMEKMSELARETGRGPALLAFAGQPSTEQFSTLVACAENLERDLLATNVGSRPGGVIATDKEVALVAAVVRKAGAAVVVVAGDTPPRVVRRLVAASRRPVLVARTRQRWEVVLSATDLETRGVPVVAAGAALAATRGASSVVLHNVAPVWVAPTAVVVPGAGGANRVARRLRRLARLAARTSPPSQVVVSSASAVDRAILDATVRRHADILVVGMRRPARRTRARCADRLVAATPGNVMVVPLGPPRRDRGMEVRP